MVSSIASPSFEKFARREARDDEQDDGIEVELLGQQVGDVDDADEEQQRLRLHEAQVEGDEEAEDAAGDHRAADVLEEEQAQVALRAAVPAPAGRRSRRRRRRRRPRRP
jgi:hypothetical protein